MSSKRQQVSQHPKMHQMGDTSPEMLEEHNQSFDVVRVEYINLNNTKYIIN